MPNGPLILAVDLRNTPKGGGYGGTHTLLYILDVEARTVPVSVSIINRSFHAEQPWKNMNEDPPDPGSHCVGFWAAEMYIENYHGDTNTATRIY